MARSIHFSGWYEKHKGNLNFSVSTGTYQEKQAVYFKLSTGEFQVYPDGTKGVCGKGEKSPSHAPEPFVYFHPEAAADEPWIVCDSQKDIPAYILAGYKKVAGCYACAKLNKIQITNLMMKGGRKFIIVTDATNEERVQWSKLGDRMEKQGCRIRYFDFYPELQDGQDATDVLNSCGILALTRIRSECKENLTFTEPVTTAGKKNGQDTVLLSDIGNANLIIEKYGDILHYNYQRKKWLIWSNTHWVWDSGDNIIELAKKTIIEAGQRAFATEDKRMITFYASSQNRIRIQNMIFLVQSIPGIPIELAMLDANPWHINCMNGTYDAEKGKILPHDKSHLITKLIHINYDSSALCPQWDTFFAEIMAGNQNLIDFLSRMVGYCSTGSTREQCFFILYGDGSNGKSTFLQTIGNVLSDYCRPTSTHVVFSKRYASDSSHQEDLACLADARMVTAIESEVGHSLSESLVKRLTGGDKISVSRKHEQSFEFSPMFKIVFAVNHLPKIRGRDSAIWRRIKIVPFGVKIPEKNQKKDLFSDLKKEYPGILNFIIKGLKKYVEQGLSPVDEIKSATSAFKEFSDELGDFVNSLVLGNQERVSAKDVYTHYVQWCGANGIEPVKQKLFCIMMTERGFQRVTIHGKIMYKGIAIDTPSFFP